MERKRSELRRRLARELAVSTRTLRTWAREAADPLRRIGRPPHDDRARARALWAVRREMKRQGNTVGEPSVVRAVRGGVPRTLVRWALRRWKRRLVRRARLLRQALRQQIRPTAPHVLAALDGAFVGRLGDGSRVKVELVRDVASQRTAVPVVGSEIGASEVVVVLDRWSAAHGGEPPLAIVTDRGPENLNGAVEAWCEEHRAVHVKNAPHTPQHNPWAEHGWGEVKAESGLAAPLLVASTSATRSRIDSALSRLNEGRLRQTLGFRSAAERDKDTAPRYTAEQREAFYTATRAAASAARDACATPRRRHRAERDALWNVMESFGLITRTRGGARRDAIPEVVS
ncbi:MAG: transposase family protein [Planctomycetes bacterium]|nr:transposase family protein [Planctomycetota bacterium]